MGDVSVVIPVHGVAPYLGAAVASVLTQTRPVFEVLVCCGDPDGPQAALPDDPRVRVIRSPATDAGTNRNAGLASMRGDWVAFLDADDLWPANRLALGWAAFDAEPHLEICHGHQQLMTAAGTLIGAPQPAPVLGTTLMRAGTAAEMGPLPANPLGTEVVAWLSQNAGLRTVTVPEVLLFRRTHSGNISGRDGHTQGLLAIVRARIQADRATRQ